MKKGRTAFVVATYLAGRCFGPDPAPSGHRGGAPVLGHPQFAELNEQVKGEPEKAAEAVFS